MTEKFIIITQDLLGNIIKMNLQEFINMKIKIIPPADLEEYNLKQIIDLIKAVGEVKSSKDKLREYILRADLIAYGLVDNRVICTATLKNPFKSYNTKVFNNAEAKTNLKFEKELGYIATHIDFEGKGYCSTLRKNSFNIFPPI